MNAERPFRIVVGVLREALRRTGRAGVVVAGGGPEEALLLSWLGRGDIPCRTPPADLLDGARSLLAGARSATRASHAPGLGAPDAEWRQEELEWQPAEAWTAAGLAGQALARAQGCLLAGTETKTLLLLGQHPSGARILPLGDLYSSEVLDLAGGCTAPVLLPRQDPALLGAVDAGLRAYVDEGAPEDAAFADLPSTLRRGLLTALREARATWCPAVLVPKLGRATLGIDLDL